jgi:hypothetical protein
MISPDGGKLARFANLPVSSDQRNALYQNGGPDDSICPVPRIGRRKGKRSEIRPLIRCQNRWGEWVEQPHLILSVQLPTPPRITLSVALADEIRNSGVGAGQRFFIGQEHDAEMLRAGLLAEAGSVDYHDVLLADEFFDEDFVALGDVDAREGVERAAWFDAAYARRGLAPLLR